MIRKFFPLRRSVILARLDELRIDIQQLEKQMSALSDSITELTSEVTALSTVVGSAITLINGISTQVQTAVDAALAAGATTEQLEAITRVSITLRDSAEDLGNAVAANTAPNGG